MQDWQKKLTAASLAAVLVCLPLWEAGAESLQDQRDDYRARAGAAKEKADEAAARADSISEQIHQIQQQVDAAEQEYRAIAGQRDAKQAEIDKEEILLETTEAELKEKSKVLEKRVHDIYINGQISYLDVLFGAKDFSDFMTRMDLLERIIKYDYELVTKVRQEQQVIKQTKEQLEKDRTALEELVKDAEAKLDVFEAKKDEQQELYDKAVYDRETSEQAYEELMAASREIEAMIVRRQGSGSAPAASGSGAMIWPISGPITSEFGWRTHPIFGTARFHSGLDIAGDYGDPIYAADSGTVIYAGWISGYGNAVIIDHGGGITTLYGHCQSLAVGEGQSVSQGQTIAYCGSTGNSTGPHCHFEVRQNGSPVSPYDYL